LRMPRWSRRCHLDDRKQGRTCHYRSKKLANNNKIAGATAGQRMA
jgi:hypothetical protein